MKKIVLCIGLLASLAFAEGVIDKDNILNQLKDLQKAKGDFLKNQNSPEIQREALQAKKLEEQKEKDAHKIAHLKKTIGAFAEAVNDDIVIPRGKYSRVEINNGESFFVFEQDIEALIYQKKSLHQKSEKIRLLQLQMDSLLAGDPNSNIQRIEADVNSLLHMNSNTMGSSTNNSVMQKPLLELKNGDVYKEYKVHSNNGVLTLVLLGAIG